MIHLLTVGFLDVQAAKRATLKTVALLDKDTVKALLAKYTDAPGAAVPTFEGAPVTIGPGFVRCPWYTPRENRTSIRFALDVQASTGCVVADIEHGRIIE